MPIPMLPPNENMLVVAAANPAELPAKKFPAAKVLDSLFDHIVEEAALR